MMRKSKVVALLAVCVMMFAAVEPALARTADEPERTWGAIIRDTVVGGVVGAVAGIFIAGLPGAGLLGVVGAAIGATPVGERVTMITGSIVGFALGLLPALLNPQK